MKNTLMTTALFMSLASTAAFAHHPAADRVDPETYAMIDENVADTPHADMVLDGMGRDMDETGSAMEDAREAMSREMEDMEARIENREMENEGQGPAEDAEMRREANVDVEEAQMEAEVDVDTMDLLDNVETALSE